MGLVLIIISFITASLTTIFLATIFLRVTLFSYYSPLFLLFLSFLFGIVDLIFFLKHSSKNKPMQYEKENKYAHYILYLGFWNLATLILPILIAVGFSTNSVSSGW